MAAKAEYVEIAWYNRPGRAAVAASGAPALLSLWLPGVFGSPVPQLP
jgi:hypothetical protein